MNPKTHDTASGPVALPAQAGLYYGGAWHAPQSDRWMEVRAPGTGELLMRVAEAGREDVAGRAPRGKAMPSGAARRRWRARRCCAASPSGCATMPPSWPCWMRWTAAIR